MIKSVYISLRSRLMASAPFIFLKDNKGIAAIEFALIAPVMLFMYFGMAEVATAISADRQISHAANVAGDLTTQYETVSTADMSEIMTATMLVMGIPTRNDADIAKVRIDIESFSRDDTGTLVKKGKASLGEALPTFAAEDLDERILSDTSGVVVARVSYLYQPLKLRYMKTDFELTETFMLKPRKSANVDIIEPTGETKYDCDLLVGGKINCNLDGSVGG